jgi:hypothetical protein
MMVGAMVDDDDVCVVAFCCLLFGIRAFIWLVDWYR